MLQKKHLRLGLTLDKLQLKRLLNNPSILLIITKTLNVPVDLIKFINHISLNLALFVYLIKSNEKKIRLNIIHKEALDFHSSGKPGKIEITPSKPMTTKRDLALAYSPGVASPVLKLVKTII